MNPRSQLFLSGSAPEQSCSRNDSQSDSPSLFQVYLPGRGGLGRVYPARRGKEEGERKGKKTGGTGDSCYLRPNQEPVKVSAGLGVLWPRDGRWPPWTLQVDVSAIVECHSWASWHLFSMVLSPIPLDTFVLSFLPHSTMRPFPFHSQLFIP